MFLIQDVDPEFNIVPVAIGFGISSPEHVKTCYHMADGAIVGSALTKLQTQYVDDPTKALTALSEFVSQSQS